MKSGSILPAGEEKWLIASQHANDPTIQRRFRAAQTRLGTYICYCSLYEKCWTKTNGPLPEALPACPKGLGRSTSAQTDRR